MENVKLGISLEGRKLVEISPDASNNSILALGMSGSGKTNALWNLESSLSKMGEAVLILDFGGTHTNFNSPNASRTIVYDEGFPIPLLSRVKRTDGSFEDPMDVADSLVDVFSNVCRLYSRQRAILRKAITAVIEGHTKEDCLMAIGSTLQTYGDEAAEAVIDKFRTLFTHVCVKPKEEPLLESGKIAILDFSGYSQSVQILLAELALASLWRYYRIRGQEAKKTLYIVCDEFQRFNLLADSVTSQILREGRKYHIALVLATQTMEVFNKAQQATIFQPATKLFFQPTSGEVRKIAKMIGWDDERQMIFKLNKLQRGECVAVGRFVVGNLTTDRPVTMKFPLYRNGGETYGGSESEETGRLEGLH